MIVLWGSSRCVGEKDDRLQLNWRKFKLSQLVLTEMDCTPSLDYLCSSCCLAQIFFPPKAVEVRVNYQWKFRLPKLATSDLAKQDNELLLPDVIIY